MLLSIMSKFNPVDGTVPAALSADLLLEASTIDCKLATASAAASLCELPNDDAVRDDEVLPENESELIMAAAAPAVMPACS